MARGKAKDNTTGANLGFESKFWSMADSLRGSMDSAEYKHVVLVESRIIVASFRHRSL